MHRAPPMPAGPEQEPIPMVRHRTWYALAWFCGALVPGSAPAADSKSPTANPQAEAARPEQVILQALASNPVTGPYQYAVGYRNGRYVVAGRVGTKQIHDAAVQ